MNTLKKKALLRKLFAEGERGVQIHLAHELSVSTRTIWLWANRRPWPKVEQERKMWNRLGYRLGEDGEVCKAGAVQALPSSTEVSALLALMGEIVTHQRAATAMYASLEQLLVQGVTVSTAPETDATVRHLQQVASEGRHALSSLQPPVPTLPPLLSKAKPFLVEDSEYDS